MKKIRIAVWALTIAGGSMLFSSCIGSFSLTKSVMAWNKTVGSKFVNELVFVAFWILPVYEVTSVADLLILNSIEFWSGKNVIQAQTKTVEGSNGTYDILSDSSGHTVTNRETGRTFRLEYDEKTDSWSYVEGETREVFMRKVGKDHIEMRTPDGSFKRVELSENGVTAYTDLVTGNGFVSPMMAGR